MHTGLSRLGSDVFAMHVATLPMIPTVVFFLRSPSVVFFLRSEARRTTSRTTRRMTRKTNLMRTSMLRACGRGNLASNNITAIMIFEKNILIDMILFDLL